MKTPLYDLHDDAGARFIEFAGWDMPVHYGSQIEEHLAVRESAGCFDVSHMAVVDFEHDEAEQLLSKLLVCDVKNLAIGHAAYTLMLNENGGIVDDLIVYRQPDGFRLVVNAGTTQKDLDWIARWTHELNLPTQASHRDDLCILAVQGPAAIQLTTNVLDVDRLNALEPFEFTESHDFFIARTGYTGEDGVEVICLAEPARKLWSQLVAAGVRPVGLGARDSLRLEAGLNLYGHDMTDDTHPFECRVAWTIDWEDTERNFIGRGALDKIRTHGSATKLVGLALTDRGIPREGCLVHSDAGEGIVTSGTFSPTLKQGIALARLPSDMGPLCQVQVRQRAIPAKIARLPFVRNISKSANA